MVFFTGIEKIEYEGPESKICLLISTIIPLKLLWAKLWKNISDLR